MELPNLNDQEQVKKFHEFIEANLPKYFAEMLAKLVVDFLIGKKGE